MKKNTGMSERILQILKSQGIKPNKFAQKLGYNRSQTIYDVINGVVNPSYDFFEKFSNSEYSKIFNTDWLLTGKGEMLNSSKNNIETQLTMKYNNKGVPYYDVDFLGGYNFMENDQIIKPTFYINFPKYNNADSWVNITGNSMKPLINNGDMIAIKRIRDWERYILYGEIYAIVTDEYRTVKKIHKSEKVDNYLRLVPVNENYDEQDVDKKKYSTCFSSNRLCKEVLLTKN